MCVDIAFDRDAKPGHLHHRRGMVHIATLPHDLVMEHEAMVIPGMQTGTPSSAGQPASPFDIQRMCGPKMENTFSPCGVALPRNRRRSIWRTACDISTSFTPQDQKRVLRAPPGRRQRVRYSSTHSGLAQSIVRIFWNGIQTDPARCRAGASHPRRALSTCGPFRGSGNVSRPTEG